MPVMHIDPIETVAAVIMLLYLWLEYRASIWLWPTGIVLPLFYIYIYTVNKFYADAAISIYYLFAGIYGWIQWHRAAAAARRNRASDPTISVAVVQSLPHRSIPAAVAVFGLLFAGITWILIRFTDSPVPVGDAFTTALSIVAMWMLAQRYIEHWWLWIVVNAVSAALYFQKGMTPTAATYIIYTIVPIFGYLKWKKMMLTHQGQKMPYF